MSIGTFEKNMSAGGVPAVAARYFIEGIEEGISWTNAALVAAKAPQLYCPPKVTLTIDQTIDIFRHYVASHSVNQNQDRVGLILLMAFREDFPCR